MITPDRLDAAVLDAAMGRALEIATRGPEGGPNPRVGCVILSPDGHTLAEGWHRGAGTAHAEVDALSHLAPGEARGATAVVTLEPCNHTGRTGPCAQALIAAGVAEVYFAVPDPGAVSSHGAQTLIDAGIPARLGPRREQAEELLAGWLRDARRGRPTVTVKWATSLDGRAAAADGTSQWITGPDARADVHLERSRHDAIAVGTGTVLADDPALTARGEENGAPLAQPIPVVFGHREVPANAQLRSHPRELITLSGDDLAADLDVLWKRGIRSVFVEGGPSLASAFIRAGFADRVLVYIAPTLIGGPKVALTDLGVDTIGDQHRLIFTDVRHLGSDLRLTAEPVAPETSSTHPTSGAH
ncbi:bifunctional diaminohydroxyphosphoribosylaminopyrimidine deaminase/5-amino-6-(5-phosphoribosylamino)uracil reductase RibD [Mycetocola sp. JXN-3]|uniref:bifunctional diaminohydroxyphosphoribosylaminopyrimidine deaminase/5-amino-6-(5-phosphoribosylamino)uracil reductase RibD n=1 Tax=Mycetocola sp. JXN-3 TaxID=2116510 RepID=UPI00165D04FC|nr:bifunctional diaminohydroxyphosphoribosylaminopyrimidine deaminase/5-amino-6-(5-phosphoribosylamino)uracil reductase RibD [Mycetocola sp. JXN-3]